MEKLEAHEHSMVYNESSIVLKNRLKELDKLKLTKT